MPEYQNSHRESTSGRSSHHPPRPTTPGIFADYQDKGGSSATAETSRPRTYGEEAPQVFPTLNRRVRGSTNIPSQQVGVRGRVTLVSSADNDEEVVTSGSGVPTYYHPLLDKHVPFSPSEEEHKRGKHKFKNLVKKVIKGLKSQGNKSSLVISDPVFERKF